MRLKGTLHKGRHDLEGPRGPWGMCQITNSRHRRAQRGGHGGRRCRISAHSVGRKYCQWVRGGTDPIVFACANPVPEIWLGGKEAARWCSRQAGQLPNQANNSGLPAIFRGA